MKKLFMIALFGCFVLITNHAYSNAIPCDPDAPLEDCFDPFNYITPIKLVSSLSPVKKTKVFDSFSCSGTYTVAVYLHGGLIPTKFMVTSTCPTPISLDDIVVWDGAAIAAILPDATSPAWSSLLLEEIRTGGNPVIFDISFHDPGETGGMVVNVYSEAWNSTDVPPNPDAPGQVADLEIYFDTRGVISKDYENGTGPLRAGWVFEVVNHNRAGAGDSTGTTVTVDLPGGFKTTDVRGDYNFSSNFQWTQNGNRITVDLGTLPLGKKQDIVILGEATKYCTRDPIRVSVTGNLDDPNPQNNSTSEADYYNKNLMETILENYPEYCQTNYGAAFLGILLLKDDE